MLINKFKCGGAEHVFASEANALFKDGWNVHVVSLYGSSHADVLSIPNTNRHELSARSWHDLRALRRLYRLLKECDATVLYANLEHANLMARLIGFCSGVRVCIRESGEPHRKPLRYTVVDNLLNVRTNCIIAVSSQVRAALARLQPLYRHKMVTIENGITITNEQCPERSEHGTHIISVGSLRAEKDFTTLVTAFARIRERNPDARLTILGEGALRPEIEATARACGVTEAVSMPGEVNRSEVPLYLREADVFVLSSVSEGFPNVILEAMAQCLPVVATRVGAAPDIVADGETGYVVEFGEPQSIAARVQDVLSDAALRRRMGRAGYERVCTVYSFDAHMQKVRDALDLSK
jgi:glycosyltransferase involved in cell wall biosynthesis